MRLFSRRPTTQQVMQARAAAKDAKETVAYVDRSLRDHGRRWSNAKVQEYRVERRRALQALREADGVLDQN